MRKDFVCVCVAERWNILLEFEIPKQNQTISFHYPDMFPQNVENFTQKLKQFANISYIRFLLLLVFLLDYNNLLLIIYCCEIRCTASIEILN